MGRGRGKIGRMEKSVVRRGEMAWSGKEKGRSCMRRREKWNWRKGEEGEKKEDCGWRGWGMRWGEVREKEC